MPGAASGRAGHGPLRRGRRRRSPPRLGLARLRRRGPRPPRGRVRGGGHPPLPGRHPGLEDPLADRRPQRRAGRAEADQRRRVAAADRRSTPPIPASEEALDRAVRAAASICAHLAAEEQGCCAAAAGRTSIPSGSAPESDGWREAHAKLALVQPCRRPPSRLGSARRRDPLPRLRLELAGASRPRRLGPALPRHGGPIAGTRRSSRSPAAGARRQGGTGRAGGGVSGAVPRSGQLPLAQAGGLRGAGPLRRRPLDGAARAIRRWSRSSPRPLVLVALATAARGARPAGAAGRWRWPAALGAALAGPGRGGAGSRGAGAAAPAGELG